jgi:class 3 adenylate cyclase/tetratricopeptide (TPR) repeat protein
MSGRCTRCGRARGTGRFCERCGAPLPRTCPSCGAPVSVGAAFCGACGLRLEVSERAASEGERRQLAVLVCDIVDSTPLAQRMDIEEFGELMLEVQQLATKLTTHFGGTVGTYAGDGLVAWFGWPIAHEDDTALAIHTGLDVLAELGELNTRLESDRGVRLAARVAVHVGPAVVRTDRPDTVAFGETFHVAARLGAYAEADTVVISEIAQRLVRGRFETSHVGTPQLKGLDRPLEVFRVEGALVGADERVPATAFSAPLVGRERELERLLDAWRRTKRGSGCTAVINGEPGVGKSRLLRALEHSLAGERHRWLELRCSPLGVNTAFRPIAEMVRVGLGIRGSDAPAERRRKIEAVLPDAESVLVAGLIGLDTDDLPPPEKFRRDLMEALRQWLLGLARKAPVVIAGEDLHWSDPSTLELVRLLQDRLHGAQILIVLTQRTEAALDLAPDTEIVLERLDPEQTRTLARHLTVGQVIPPQTIEHVVERSDGVPLFLEELVAALGGADDGSGLPSSLQSSLLARLDRLGDAREVAQIASVIGRSFPEELLASATNMPTTQLDEALRTLAGARLIEGSASIDGLRYQFRHALIRDAAYASLLRPRRVQLHRKVAQVLEERFRERAARSPELLGHHFALGEEPLRAAKWFEQAGLRAAGSAALAEAAAHYRRGLELVRDLAPGEERDGREMWLSILLSNALMGLEGHGADSLRPVWRRAIELGERVGNADELTAALNGLAVQEADNGDLDAALALAQRQIKIAERTDSRFARLRGHGTMGLVLFYKGGGRAALEHFRASLACYRRGDFQTVTFGVGHDQGIFARAMSSWTLWWLGLPDAAIEEIEEAVSEAEQLGSFLTLAMARHFLAMAHELRGEREQALKQATLNAEFAHELGFKFWEGVALLTAGAERTRLGNRDGLAEIGSGLDVLRDAGSHAGTSSGLATLAQAQQAAGDTAAALATVDAALKLSREFGQPYWDAELMRLKGEFLFALDRGPVMRAEMLLRRALADATNRGAAALALRAASSLARRLSERGRAGEARAALAGALAAIEGGEDTADVREARALFAELPLDTLEVKELR